MTRRTTNTSCTSNHPRRTFTLALFYSFSFHVPPGCPFFISLSPNEVSFDKPSPTIPSSGISHTHGLTPQDGAICSAYHQMSGPCFISIIHTSLHSTRVPIPIDRDSNACSFVGVFTGTLGSRQLDLVFSWNNVPNRTVVVQCNRHVCARSL